MACAVAADERRGQGLAGKALNARSQMVWDLLEEAKLRFAMGKYFDDLGNFSKAFEQFRLGNALQKLLGIPYDRVARKKFIDE